ncbi:MAG: divalent metal cation transporter [Actinomycetota bacterium]|nr:divalent metal cation transporter [Actinomycetota bacterium]
MVEIRAKNKISSEILLYIAVAGPGIITAIAGIGASGITTCSVAGARYGLSIVWILILSMAGLALFQEMSARMGAVTGKGLAALIRERFGLRAAFLVTIVLLIGNIGNNISEFAGITASLEIFGFGNLKYFGVPLIALVLWVLIIRGSFKWVEKAFMALCLIQLCYIASGFLANPDWSKVGVSILKPEIISEPGFIYVAIAIVGTTIAPWMQFFVQGNVVDKGTGIGDLMYQRIDIIAGLISANVVSLFIIICMAFTIYPGSIDTFKEAAFALNPLAGGRATLLFALGLFGASMLSAGVIPISTSYAVCEALGLERGIGRKLSEAHAFFGIFTFSMLASVVIVLIPGISLVSVLLLAQVLNGMVVPIVLVFMLLLVNDTEIMGDHVNGPVMNFFSWLLTICIVLMNLFLIFKNI